MIDLEKLIEQYVIDIENSESGILLNKREAVWSSGKIMPLEDGIKYLIENNMTVTINPYSRNEELLLTYIVNSGLSENNIAVS